MLLEFSNIVVGSCVSALLKSYVNNYPIILVDQNMPTPDVELGQLVRVQSLQSKSAFEIWSILKFILSMRGKIVNTVSLPSVRIEGDILTFRDSKIKFNKCHLFHAPVVSPDLDINRVDRKDMYKTVDFLRLKFCDATNLGSIFPKDTFIDTIKSIAKKDLIAVSFLEKENLNSFDYSDTIVRMITEKLLLDSDRIVRPSVGRHSNSLRKPKLEVIKRDVFPLEEVVFKSTKRIKYYDGKKRINIIKTYCRNNPSIQS